MGKIFMIRHGQASFGDENYDRLSEIGNKQSEITGQYFQKAGFNFDVIYTGTMKRQQETAEMTLKFCNNKSPIYALDAFNEYDFNAIIKSQFDGLIRSEPSLLKHNDKLSHDREIFRQFFGKIMQRWVSGNHDVDGVETFIQYVNRIEKGLKSVTEKHKDCSNIAIFSSGGVIAVSMCFLLNITAREALKLGWFIKNCSVTSFLFNDKGFQLETFNSVAHIEMQSLPELLTLI